MSGTARSGLGNAASGDMNHGVLNSAANSSGPSMGGSSQVTDANSSFSGGPQLPSSSSINDESYMHLPASPMSSSNNISGSSVMDGSSIVQLSPQNEQIQKQGALSPTYQSMVQDAGMLPVQKRPRLDMRVGDVSQQQAVQQMLQRHQNLQLQAIVQPQRLAQIQQQQMLQSLPQLQRIQMHQQPQMPMPSPLQLISPVRPPFESGLCARRLMQYMYHQSHRPADNSILYWRKFAAEYFAPRAKKRWCFSLYNNAGNHAFGAFPQAAMDAWQCGICGSKSGKGFEATYEVIPRLDQIKFDHGILDELLYLDMPHESRLPSGMMVLEYAKAVQESVHEQCRVVREGQLRIIFTPDLKILCWEFCARRHEELLPRRVIVNQVNQLLHAAHKCQTAVNEKGSAVSAQDLQASCNMFVSAGRQLARNVELQLLNDLGFPKRYVRCLQISEVVNCMKDLIDFSQSHKMGPIDSLKNYTQQAAAKLQAQKMKMEQTDAAQNLLADQNTLNTFMAMHPGLGRHPGNTLSSTCFPNNSSQTISPMTNYQHLLRNSPNPGHSPMNSDASFAGLNQTKPMPFQTSGPFITAGRTFQYTSTKNQQQQLQDLQGKPPPPSNNEHSSQANQNFQQHINQQHMPEMMNKGALPTTVKDFVKAEIGVISGPSVAAQVQNGSGICTGEMPREIKRGIMPSNNDASKPAAMNNNLCASSNSCNVKQEVFENLNLADFDQDLLGELLDGIDW